MSDSETIIDQGRGPVVLFAHGAGAPMDTPFMSTMAAAWCEAGFRVVRFEFPYMRKRRNDGKRRGPDRMPLLEGSFRELAARYDDLVAVGGKSMGGRVATRILAASAAAGAFALGYPFHPPGKPEKLRIDHLRESTKPICVIQGERDRFGLPQEVERYRLPSHVRVHWIPDGDHGLMPRKRSGYDEAENLASAAAAVIEFLRGLR